MKIDRFCKNLLRLSIFFVQILPGNDGAGIPAKRSRDDGHIAEILLRPLDRSEALPLDDPRSQNFLSDLQTVYERKIRPLELATKFFDPKIDGITSDGIRSKPIILVVGPWSTGKTTFLKYLLDISDDFEHLGTGVNPTTNDFLILSHGPKLRIFDGQMLLSPPNDEQPPFDSKFLEHLYKIEMPKPLLQNLTFVDTPGFMEHKKLPDRGYPFNGIMKWWVRRADLILVIFDPTKLDVGSEVDALFSCLKGKESMVRIILNKADSVRERELMRVYGSLLWSLAPLFNVTEPPRVYVGSFWHQKPHPSDELGKMLLQEEKALLNDLRQTITKQLFTKILRMEMKADAIYEYSKSLIKGKGANFDLRDLKTAILEDLPLLKQKLSRIITADEDLDFESSKNVEESMKEDSVEETSFSDLFEHNLGRGYENHPEEITEQVRKMIKRNKRSSKSRKKRKTLKNSEEEKQENLEAKQIPGDDNPKEATKKCRPYRKTCIEIVSSKTRSESGAKKCIMYRRSCNASKIKVEKLVEPEKVVTQNPKIEPSVPNLDPKCPPYRKKCDNILQESVKEANLPKIEKCPPYRKSCKAEIQEEEKVEKAEEKPTAVVEEPKTTKCPLYRKQCDLDKVKDLPIEVQTSTICPKYRKSCAEIDDESLNLKSDLKDGEKSKKPKSDEKSTKEKSGQKPKKLKSAEKSKKESKKQKSEELLEMQNEQPLTEKSMKSEESSSEENLSSRRRILDSDEDPKEGVLVEDVEDKEHPKKSKEKRQSSKEKKKPTRLLTEQVKEENQRKCPPYRKSCDPSTISKTGETFTSWSKFLSGLIFGKPSIKARKCILYRKSCSKEQPNQEEQISVPKNDQKSNKKTAESNEIKRQKESIAPSDRAEEIILEKTYPTEQEKCLNYRKSCQEPKLRTNEQANVEKTTEKLLQYTKREEPAQKNCPIYRKSCESSPKIATFVEPAADATKNADNDSAEKTTGKCPIYRKSCAKHSADQKSHNEGRGGDDENFIYVLDKKTGKTTKYCKKKSAKSKKQQYY